MLSSSSAFFRVSIKEYAYNGCTNCTADAFKKEESGFSCANKMQEGMDEKIKKNKMRLCRKVLVIRYYKWLVGKITIYYFKPEIEVYQAKP
jgi:hypothetical protein